MVRPASVATYGIVFTKSDGSPCAAAAFDTASATPNRKEAAAEPSAVCRPIASAARAIHPRLLSISLENQDTYPMDMNAPPNPHITPLNSSATACIFVVLIPTDSAAAFFSPTARI